MAERRRLTLSTFDGRLLDGLKFCKQVYDMYDQVRSEAGGTSKLRMRASKREKRLTEELIPIARYIQTKYAVGRRIKIRWQSGSQPFDAVLLSSGHLVENGLVPRKVFIEVTRAVHPKEHLGRELLDQGGISFGSAGIMRDKKTKKLNSSASWRDADEIATEISDQIIERLQSKAAKGDPKNTVLIIEYVPESIVLDEKWIPAIKRVRLAQIPTNFCEVFVMCGLIDHSASI